MEEDTQQNLEEQTSQNAPPRDVLAECVKERDEYLEGWKRTKADFTNYKKEETERLRAMVQIGTGMLVGELLNVIDSLEVGLTLIKDDDPTKKGMLLVRNQLEDILKKHGLSQISIEPGGVFNPAYAEALYEVESQFPPGSLVEEISKGYMFHGKVLRPARVTIAKGHTSS